MAVTYDTLISTSFIGPMVNKMVSGVTDDSSQEKLLKYMLTYGEAPSIEEARKLLGKDSLNTINYNNIIKKAKKRINKELESRDADFTFDQLKNKIPEVKENAYYKEQGYTVELSGYTVKDKDGNIIRGRETTKNENGSGNVTKTVYGKDGKPTLKDDANIDYKKVAEISETIAKDFSGLGGNKQQQQLVQYYLEHGDLPKDIVDKYIGRDVGTVRYNHLVSKLTSATDSYFKANPDDSVYKEFLDRNIKDTTEGYKDYDFNELNKFKTDSRIADTAVSKFNITGTDPDEEQALVEHFMTYGTISKADMKKLMEKDNIGDVRYNTILKKIQNAVAETMRENGYMPNATNAQIIASIYKGSEQARNTQAAGGTVTFGTKLEAPTEEENKPLNSSNSSNSSNTDDIIDEYEKPSYKEESFNQYYKDTWDTSPGTTAYSIWSGLTQAERNAATEAMSLADASYQNAMLQQAATVKNITDQVRAERMAKLRAGMNESQIANQDMQMMMSNINAMNDRITAMNDTRLAAQSQYNLAQDTAYKEYLNQAQAMNQTGAAYYAAQAGDPYSQALNYMNKTGSSFSDSFKAVTTGTTDSTKK